MEENNVVVDNSNTTEEVALETTENTEVTVEETQEESVEEVKARLAKAEEVANNYKIRAEKAERLAKNKSPEAKQESKQTQSNVSTKDLYALVDAKVVEEDIPEVEEYARFKGITISEALKTSTLKAILAEKNENRTVAKATNVSTSRRSTAKQNDDTLLEKATKGELPDSEDDLVRLIKARKGFK